MASKSIRIVIWKIIRIIWMSGREPSIQRRCEHHGEQWDSYYIHGLALLCGGGGGGLTLFYKWPLTEERK